MRIWLLVSSLGVLSWAAEAIYSVYDPHVVYGVIEPRKDGYISYNRIRDIDPNLNQYVTGIVRGFACGYIYGCEVSLDDVCSKTKNNETDAVDRFAKKYNLGKPCYMTALSGDYEPCDAYSYDPDEQESTSNKTSNSDNDSENSEDNEGISAGGEEISCDGPASLENTHQTDGTTKQDEDQNIRNGNSHSSQQSFHKENLASCRVAQDYAIRIKMIKSKNGCTTRSADYVCTQAKMPRFRNAALGLLFNSRPALQKWGDGGRLSLRQSNS